MRGLGIACRLSVCPSVTLVISDHIGWKSWKLIVRAISLTPSLIEAKRRSDYSQRNMGEILGDKRWGRENGVLENKSASISETRKDGGKVTMDWRAYRNSPTLFRMVPSPTPYGPLPQDWGFAT